MREPSLSIILLCLLFLLSSHLYGASLLGDLDDNGQITRADINELARTLAKGSSASNGDVDRSGSFDDGDIHFLEYYINLAERDLYKAERTLLEVLMGHNKASPEFVEETIKDLTKTSETRRIREFSRHLRSYLERGGGSFNEPPFNLSIPARDIAALSLAALYDRESRLLIVKGAQREKSRLMTIEEHSSALLRACRSYEHPVSEGTKEFVKKRQREIEKNITTALAKTKTQPTVKPVDVSETPNEAASTNSVQPKDKKPQKSSRGLIVGLVLILVGGSIIGVAFWKMSGPKEKPKEQLPKTETPLTRANRYFSIKKYEKAIPEYQKVLESPHLKDETSVRLKLAKSFTELGRYELATVHIEQMDLSRGSLEDTYDLARSFEDHGQHDLAQRLFETICARKQNFKDVAKRLSELKEKTELINVFDPRVVERRFAPRYGTFSILGKGGMGVVFKARDRQERKVVAIKVILPELAEEVKFRKRFDREIDALVRLQHPAIVNVIASGKEPLYHYVMEFVEGRPLHDLVANRVLFQKYEQILVLARNLAQALAHAHNQGVLHRDIKPANILMMPDNQVKVLDFGVARVTDTTKLTVTGEFVGTLAYCAPELIYGAEATKASDVFSYGMVLFELVTNERPWSSEELLAGIDRQAAKVTDVDPDCPDKLAKTINACLETDPQKRLADFEQVLTMLA